MASDPINTAEGETRAVRRRLETLMAHFPKAFHAALYQEAVEIFNVSQDRVPVDTGRLRASGGVSPPIGIINTVVKIYYGTEYARRQHFEHSTKKNYLQGPMLEAVPGMVQRLIKRIEENVGNGTSLGTIPDTPGEGGESGSTEKRKPKYTSRTRGSDGRYRYKYK